MIATKPFILYTLPKSRTTQALLHKNDIKKVWQDIETFFNNCTTTSISNPSNATLTVFSAIKEDKHPQLIQKILSNTEVVFGKGEKVSMGSIPDFVTWDIKNDSVQKAIEFLAKGRPWPNFFFGPVELYVTYDFKLINPNTREELPNQENISSVLIWLSRRCRCTSDLWFPFPEANKEFEMYLNKIEKFLPFVLERKYLKIGKPNATRTAHIFRKL